MKITDFVSRVTRLEGGKRQTDVAQVAEVLKVVNAELWGVPYMLIRLKGKFRPLGYVFMAIFSIITGFAAALGVSHVWRMHEPPHTEGPTVPDPADPMPGNDCQDNTPPVAVIEVTPGPLSNEKGLAEIGILVSVIVGMFLLFVPNPVSNVTGIGVRPNKTVEQRQAYEKVEILKDEKGNPVLAADGSYMVTKKGIEQNFSDDKQQRVGFLESIMSLPRLVMLGIILAIIFPASGIGIFMRGVLRNVKNGLGTLRGQTSQIVKGVKRGVESLPTAAVALPTGAVVTLNGVQLPVVPTDYRQTFLDALSKAQDESTKRLVKDLLKDV